LILDEKSASNGFTQLKKRAEPARSRNGEERKGDARFHWWKARPTPDYGGAATINPWEE
jgi:hypothetical protein